MYEPCWSPKKKKMCKGAVLAYTSMTYVIPQKKKVFLQNKLAQVYAILIRHEYPEQWQVLFFWYFCWHFFSILLTRLGKTEPCGRHDSFTCDMNHSCGTWLVHVCDLTWLLNLFSCIMCVTGPRHSRQIVLQRLCAVFFRTCLWMANACLRHDVFTCAMTLSHVTLLIHMWRDSFTCHTT